MDHVPSDYAIGYTTLSWIVNSMNIQHSSVSDQHNSIRSWYSRVQTSQSTKHRWMLLCNKEFWIWIWIWIWTSCNYLQLRCAALLRAALQQAFTSCAALRCFQLVILHKSYHPFTHELRCAALRCASKNTLCVFTIWVITARCNQSQKTRRCCRRSKTSPLKILNCIEQINNLWCIAA